MVTSANLQTRSTGLTSITVRISKNGGTDAAGGGSCTEVGASNMPGVYYYECATGDIDTLGTLSLVITKTSQEPREIVVMVAAMNLFDAVRLGLTSLPNAAAEAAGGLYTRGSGAGQINQDANGRIDANTKTWISGTIPSPTTTGVPTVAIGTGGLAYAAFAADAAGVIGVIRTGTAASGASGSITLDSGASSTNSYYKNTSITIISGTGAGQTRVYLTYIGATKVYSVDSNWVTNPDNTSVFVISPAMGDAFTRLGAPAGASVSADLASVMARLGSPAGANVAADIAAIQADTDNIQTRIPTSLVSGRMDVSVGALAANVITSAGIATDAIAAAGLKADAVSKIADAIFAYVIEAAPTNATTFLQRQRIEWALLMQKASGLAIAANGTEAFRDAADSKDRATFTLSTAGTRVPGTFDGT